MNPRYPAMAALLAASLGTMSPGTSHAEPQKNQAKPSCPADLKKETDLVNGLTLIVACEEGARTGVGERLARYVLAADEKGPLFVARQISEKADNSVAVANAAKEWASKAAPAQVAELYFVMGDEKAPAWLAAGERKQIAAALGKSFECVDLDSALKRRWRKESGEGRIGWDKFADNVSLFLSDAARSAHEIIGAGSLACKEKRERVLAGERRPDVPVASGARRAAGPPQFSYEDLYLSGGAMARVKGPKDEDAFDYYLKLETYVDPDTGDQKTYVGVYDVNETPCYIRRVPINAAGPQTIQHASGRWNLVVDIKGKEGGDLAITLRRPDDKGGDEGGFTTSASHLGRMRFDQAVEKGQVVSVGGQDYYVLGQGGGKQGSLLFFNASLASREDASWRELRPELAAVTSRVSVDGEFVPVKGKPGLHGAESGADYHLEYDARARKWEVRKGAGDKAPPLPDAAAAPGKQGSPASTIANLTKSVADWKDAEGLSEAARGYEIQSRDEGGKKLFTVLTPPNFFPKNGSPNVRGYGADVANARGVGHYIALEKTNGQVLYQDLLKAVDQDQGGLKQDFENVALVSGAGSAAPELNGMPDSKNAVWRGDFDVLGDALRRYLGYSAADTAKAVDSVRALTQGAEYVVSKADKNMVFIALKSAPGKALRAWPAGGSAEAPHGVHADTQGAGMAYDAPASEGAQVPMIATMPFEKFGKLLRKKMHPDDENAAQAGLYMREPIESKDKPDPEEWYLLVKYRDSDGKVRRTKELLVFSKDPKSERDPAPDLKALNLRGYADEQAGIKFGLASVKRVNGSTQARGVWALHRAPTQQVSKQSCVGPVLWWGLSEAEAKTAACVKDRLE